MTEPSEKRVLVCDTLQNKLYFCARWMWYGTVYEPVMRLEDDGWLVGKYKIRFLSKTGIILIASTDEVWEM